MTSTSSPAAFPALILRAEPGSEGERNPTYQSHLETLSITDLPAGEVLIKVDYSDLNYKDALAVTGRGPVVRKLPLVPGIDLAGRVVESSDERYREGDRVILTGWGVGEKYWGGYANYARCRGDWLVPMPSGLDPRSAMIIGTAGFTAMLCVQALEDGGLGPDSGPVVVSGASGGVGSVSVMLLSRLGYEVHAVSGKPEASDYLTGLGAQAVLPRSELEQPARPLETARWAGAIDSVGGQTLARILAETRDWGSVAACGLAGGHELPTTVMPFILRGVRLQGINSVTIPRSKRIQVWQKYASSLPMDLLEKSSQEIGLDQIYHTAMQLLDGRVTGRTLVNLKR